MGKSISSVKNHYLWVGSLILMLFLLALYGLTYYAHHFWISESVQILSKFLSNLVEIFSIVFGLAALVTALSAIKQVQEMKTQRLESYTPKLTLVKTTIPIKDLEEYYFCGNDEDFKNSYHGKLKEKNSERITMTDFYNCYDSGSLYINLYNIGEGFARNIRFEWKINYHDFSKELNKIFKSEITKYDGNTFYIKKINGFESVFGFNNNNVINSDILAPVKYSQKAEKCLVDSNVHNILDEIFDLHLQPSQNILKIKSYLKIEYHDKNEEITCHPEFFEIVISVIYDKYLNLNEIFPSEIIISPKIIGEKEYLEN